MIDRDRDLCARVAARLSAYADEELEPRERRAVALHIARCADCRAERDAILALGRIARDAPAEAPAAGLAARVRSGDRARPAPSARRVAAAAALVLVTAGALTGAYLIGRAHGAASAPTDRTPGTPLSPADPAEARDLGPDRAAPWALRDRTDNGLTGGPLLSPR